MYQIVLFLILLMPFGQLFGQGQNPHFIKIIGQTDGDRVLLRWIASDYETWQEGIEKGFTLERMTTHVNGVANSGSAAFNSKITLGPNLQPLSATEWDTDFPGNNFGALAKGTLYEDDPTVQLDGNLTLADVLNANESRESRFLFALFAAEQDFEVAKGMALGFEDLLIEPHHRYLYTIKMNNPGADFEDIVGRVLLDTDDQLVLPPVEDLLGEGGDKTAIIEWNIETTKDHYSTYDIERSEDRTTFVKVNDLPFVFGSDAEEDPEYAAYRDSLENNETTYYYRVRGRTAFGLQGPPSEMIEIHGVPARLDLIVDINDHHADETKVELLWNEFDENFRDQIQGFNVYRSTYSGKEFEKVNTTLLDPGDRSFTDATPMSTAYYQLEAIDKNDHSYLSSAELVQLSDSTPPAIPTGFTGTFITPTRVELSWNANTEEDLKGYRIMVANQLESNYTQITKSAILNERFIYDIEPDFMVEHIYFKILATDHRDNYSEESEALEIERPDKIAPSIPVMHKVNPSPEGIQIGFRFSESADVTRHVLERKPAGSPGWVEVLTITRNEEENFLQNLSPNGVTSTCYIDETTLERREYDYRFLAYDDHENVASSDVITVRPYDNGLRGTVNAVNGIAECVPLGDISNQEAYEIIDYLILYYGETGQTDFDALKKLVYLNVLTESQFNDQLDLEPFEINVMLNDFKMEILGGNVIGKIFLKWDYDSEDQLTDFQIFRSTEGSAMMLYKTLPLDQLPNYIYEDEDVKPGRRYFYQVMARHQGGGFSKRSEMVMVKVPKY